MPNSPPADERTAGAADGEGSERRGVSGPAVDRRGRQDVSDLSGPEGATADSSGVPTATAVSEAGRTRPQVSGQPGEPERRAVAAGAASGSDAASVAAPSPAAGAGSEAELLRAVEEAWGDIRAKVREFGAAVHALLSGASVSRIEGDVIVFAHQHAPLAERLSGAQNLAAVQSAVRAVLGRDHAVRWEVGSASARPAAAQAGGRGRGAAAQQQQRVPTSRGQAPPNGRGVDAPNGGGADPNGRKAAAPAAPRFSRPSQANKAPEPSGGGPRTGSESRSFVGEDDIPPPDFPDLPDDPGPGDYPPPDPGAAYETSGGAGSAVSRPPTPEEEQEMLDAAAVPVAPEDRRDPDEVALELLRSELGATRLDG
ncbi:hypothetical protein [Nocardia aurea]|uniref:hypothetical protein n=1 Tax=Nocardia aurea TaxID=2144174 RepID=UPI0033AF209A